MTREFLNLISVPSDRNGHRSCAVFGLFDYDPDGISILSTYKYGSYNLAHESETIKCPTMQWIGVKASDFAKAIIMNMSDGLMPLSKRDRRLATRMLNRDPFCENRDVPMWRNEVQSMLMLNIKVEIQFLECYDGGLSGWLSNLVFEKFQGKIFPN
jgi:meiotic recombination protein SPO11